MKPLYLDFQQLFEKIPGLYLALTPDMKIAAATNAYLKATLTERDKIIGQDLFDIFPNNPDDPRATGVTNLHALLQRVIKSKTAEKIPVQKYDIPRPKKFGGGFEERYWTLCTTPVLDKKQAVQYLIHQVEDVTDMVLLQNEEAKTKAFNEELKREIDERRQTEDALRLSEQKFRLLVESLPIGVWLLDDQGNVQYGNRSAQDIWAGANFSGPVEYARIKAWWLGSGEPVKPHQWAPVKVLKTRDKVVGDEVKIQRFDGKYAKIINSAFPLFDEKRQIIGVLVTNQDVTEEKHLEQEREELLKRVEEERRWIEAVIETAPMGILLMKGKKGETIVPNKQLKKIFGPDVDWSTGHKAFVGIISEPDTCNAVEFDRLTAIKALKGETTTGVEELLCLPGGSKIPVLANSGPISNASGEVIGAVTIYQDISELKRIAQEREAALQELDQEKRWLLALFEGAPMGIVIIRAEDPENPTPNEKARSMAGTEIDWDLGRESYLGNLFDAKGKVLTKEQLPSTRVLRGETVMGEEYLFRFPDGHETPLLVVGGAIDDENHKRLGAVIFFQDISPLKEAEKFREEWSAIIAHDLRQPVTKIQLAAELLRSSKEGSERIRELAEMVESSAKQINRMTHDLLEVSQLEAQKLKLERQELDIVKFIDQMIEKYQYLFPTRPIKLDTTGQIPTVHVDPDRLEQILGNLISNAAKYGYPQSEIQLAISRNARYIQVSITNEGMGLDAHDLENLFQRFHRTSQARTKGIKGVGLGLYITKGLVEAHGGEIHAASEPGKTTTFTIKLPRRNTRLSHLNPSESTNH